MKHTTIPESKMNLLFLDTETTGHEEQDRICQIAYKGYDENGEFSHCQLYKPPIPIGLVATSITHITNEMVKDCNIFIGSLEHEDLFKKLHSDDYVLIAHNAPFDVSMLNKEGIYPKNVIDTLKIVKHMNNPSMEKHNLQYLRYFYELDKSLPEGIVINPHDAMSDVIILEQLFYAICKESNKPEVDLKFIKYMIKRSADPAYIPKFNFGKYNGELTIDVAKKDPSYLTWLLSTKNPADKKDEDWIYTINKVLNERNNP